MKIMTFFLILGMGVGYANNSYSQATKLNLDLKNKTIKEVFAEIEKNSEYIFLYHDENLDTNKKVSVSSHGQTIDKVLDQIFHGTNNTYFISDRQVYISKTKEIEKPKVKEQPQPDQNPDRILIIGVVTDNTGEPLIGVTVKPKKGVGAVTGLDGDFSIYVTDINETLTFTYVGMETKDVKLKSGTTKYKVVLESASTELESVVVEAGILQRNKLGFTGSYSTVTADELKSVGNINVLQTLKSLDPAFVITDNNIMGSDPNTKATVTMRGGSTMSFKTELDDNTSNPNEPLFILDGFETDIQTINDLDINRIESITLLKDAGSTAIYGSKGANGVVVVETKKPKSGEVIISYNGDFQIAAADLSQYRMMNAKEKLQFEVLAGRYKDITHPANNQSNIDKYNNALKRVAEGADTDWLHVPLRTAFTQAHSLQVSGGNKDFLYQIGANYRNTEGVMKDSKRETFGGNARITYRNAEKKINISNNVSILVVNGHNGAWGKFSDYVNANPYYRKKNPDGSIPDMLDKGYFVSDKAGEATIDEEAPNPYYNGQLNSYSDDNSLQVVNNTSFDWFINDGLRWQASLSINSTKADNESFIDPRHTSFRKLDYSLQGTYSGGSSNSWGYNANTSLTFSHSLNDAHNITLIGRAAVSEKDNDSKGFSAVGFPKGVDGIPSFALGYTKDSNPSYSQSTSRMASFLLGAYYNYKWRYVFDFNYNLDGSSTFGSNKQFQDFWNVGAAWNVHKEDFAQDMKNGLLEELKLRASYGINGNQNVSNVSESVYKYYTGSNLFGLSSYMNEYANRNLEWQVVKKLAAGIDLGMLNRRLRATFDIYNTKTDPMVVPYTMRPSSGLSTLNMNMGHLTTKGVEFTVAYYVIKDVKNDISLNVRLTGGHSDSEYGGFGNKLKELNDLYRAGDESNREKNQSLNSLIRYEDGNSPNTLWAVKSLGIDPATGKEVFLTKNGIPTFSYNSDDRVPIGNSNPDIEGVFSFDFRYKRLTTSMFFRYKLGAYAINRALYNKVENIGKGDLIYNQDKRALYDRWKQAGDVSRFSNINVDHFSSTPVSSRFIQKNDEFKGESFRIAWDVSRDKWIKKFALQSLQFYATMNDLFVIGTMKQERSFDYPFQRTVSLGLSATF
ncbi:MAG: SusC/RagA family TonB-linked outer membrane protein [Dysgonomonas sp.]|nr:SusC/RagA family TonB-linked outer membrane protein [Dysgonomonas sp.]